MKFSGQQEEALSKAGAWLRMRWSPTFYMAGYAGTGKSTLAKHIASHEKGQVRFAAFTGKAARVMRQKGCKGAQTIHSLIYFTEVDEKTGTATTELNPNALDDVSLVVIDECSMVNEELGKDLLSFGVPVLVLGDPAQLPPVKGAGFFTSRTPDYMLTDVHRQAADSPIIRLATAIREGRSDFAPSREPGLTICRRANLDQMSVTEADAIIVGRNATRQAYNGRLRQLKGFSSALPEAGETLICLRNDRNARIFNGEIYTVDKAAKPKKDKYGRSITLRISDPESRKRDPFSVKVREEFFASDESAKELPFAAVKGTQQFTFGYAMTCHKAQGSQWPSVCVFDESRAFGDDARRWLYTASTRASEHLTLVI
jgi:ATP-dependent exoDNAse (exonuclease V) alpha subunit